MNKSTKSNIFSLIISIAIPLAVGGLSSLLSSSFSDLYETIEKPPLSPPGIVFPIVWSILYILMGVSTYLVHKSETAQKEKYKAFYIYSIQLFLNFLWPILFFRFQNILGAFLLLIILWISVITMIVSFSKYSKAAAILQTPYLIWVTFAGYLNFMIYILN